LLLIITVINVVVVVVVVVVAVAAANVAALLKFVAHMCRVERPIKRFKVKLNLAQCCSFLQCFVY